MRASDLLRAGAESSDSAPIFYKKRNVQVIASRRTEPSPYQLGSILFALVSDSFMRDYSLSLLIPIFQIFFSKKASIV